MARSSTSTPDRRISSRRSPAEGIALRHSRHCASRQGSGCSCRPTFQAQAWSSADDKPIRRTFPTLAAARAWRQDTQVALRQRRLSAPTKVLVREAAAEWLEAAHGGVVRTRSGRPYKPATLRSYEATLENRVLPALGNLRLSAVTRRSVQDLIDDLVRAGLSPSTIHNTVMPLRAVYRRALSRGDVAANPTLGLSLPVSTGRRERVARPEEADALIAALSERDRALWATALYAGLRRGELQALRWSRVDLDAGIIRVTNGWDREAGLIEPKSRAAWRRVPLPAALRPHLVSQRLRQGAADDGFVFAATGITPFDPPTIARRAKRAWLAAGLEPINLHECRHTFAAYMVAAGVNVKALSSYLGHSSISTTLDRYGHLLPGNEREAASLLDAYLGCGARPAAAGRGPALASEGGVA